MEDSKTEELSNPDNDRIKRKAALNAARQKLALRKKQREELRAQRAARLNGKIDIYTSTSSSTSSSANQKAVAIKKQQSLFSFTELEEKPSKPSNSPNKASLLRAPRKYDPHSIHIICFIFFFFILAQNTKSTQKIMQ